MRKYLIALNVPKSLHTTFVHNQTFVEVNIMLFVVVQTMKKVIAKRNQSQPMTVLNRIKMLLGNGILTALE